MPPKCTQIKEEPNQPARRTAEVTNAAATQIANCMRLKAPIPKIFPAMSSVGLTLAIITSIIRELFSSATPEATMFP